MHVETLSNNSGDEMSKPSRYEQSPVFIVGGSRTGSELIRNILITCSEIDLLPEMALIYPRHLHRDFRSRTRSIRRNLHDDRAINDLVELIYSGQLYGMFWEGIGQDLGTNKKPLRERLLASDRTLRGIFLALMELSADVHRKTIIGAKFPVHISYAPILRTWFPNCKIVHTIRDPRASYASQARKREKKWTTKTGMAWERALQFAHINIQFRSQVWLHRHLADQGNYYLLRYEKLVENSERELRTLCKVLEIDFSDQMLKPTLRNSSYGEKNRVGGEIAVNSLDSWRKYVTPAASRIMYALHASALRSMGYEECG